jgi:hypothetical protein
MISLPFSGSSSSRPKRGWLREFARAFAEGRKTLAALGAGLRISGKADPRSARGVGHGGGVFRASRLFGRDFRLPGRHFTVNSVGFGGIALTAQRGLDILAGFQADGLPFITPFARGFQSQSYGRLNL